MDLVHRPQQQHIPVYRLSERKIGCSLAESAERDAYAAWLHRAARVPKSLHVVYINTSLVTKAQAHELVPTITCTSSNVLQTVLQSYAQIPGLTIWCVALPVICFEPNLPYPLIAFVPPSSRYGPDTYMGENLHNLLTRLSQLPDDRVAAVHPAHTAASIRQILQVRLAPACGPTGVDVACLRAWTRSR
jgi:quinolinate synthase